MLYVLMLFSCGEQSLIYTRLRGEASDDCVGGVNDGHCAGRSNTMLHDEGDHNQLSSSAVSGLGQFARWIIITLLREFPGLLIRAESFSLSSFATSGI